MPLAFILKKGNEYNFFSRNIILNITFVLFLAIILITRLLILFKVNLPFIDSDQPFMWAGVKDYSEVRFYEPRFYGQNYNTFLEALFAVPLYWLHVPVYYALPIATHFLSLFPFLFTAFYLFFHQKKENALLVLAIVLCETWGYDILTGIPRGFVTGLFFCSFFILSIFNPFNLRYIALNTVLAIAGYFVNPNSVIVSLPVLFFLFLRNYRNRNYYIVTLCSLLSAILFYLLFDLFYKLHPSYVILELRYDFNFSYFREVISHLDRHFAHISFFVEENSIFLLLAFGLLSIALYRQNRTAFYSLSAFVAILFFSFFSGKTLEGVVWPFYSYSRMFIGIPLLIALLGSTLSLRSKFLFPCLFLLVLGFTSFKFLRFQASLDYHTKKEDRWNGVHLVSLASFKDAAGFYNKVCHDHHCDHFLISNAFWACTYMNYGGRLILNDFPSTEETEAERRYWVWDRNKNKVYKRFIFLSVKFDFDKATTGRYKFNIKRLDDWGLFLIENNELENEAFIKLVRTLEHS